MGVDANGDGIGDNPYIIDADNRDCYPLMHPWSSFPIHNLNTGLGYAKIQEAINTPETLNGHTIFVEAGTYYESVVVNKSVSLVGEDLQSTIIDGGGSETVLEITMDGVNVTGFTIQNSGVGIYLESANYCDITGNNITNNGSGIRLEWSSDYNSISENSLTENHYYGVWLSDYSNYNSIAGNNVTANKLYGIYLSQSSYNSISGNVFVNDGLAVSHSYGNVVDDNLVNGKPLIYLEGVSDYAVEDAGQVVLVNCSHITVKNLNLSNTAIGIQLWKTNNTEISGSTMQTSKYGLVLYESSYNNISINSIKNNDYGVRLYSSSSSNIVSGNNFIANNDYGVWLWDYSNNNTISGNNITNNEYGIVLDRSCNFNTVSGNTITANNGDGVVLSQSSNHNGIFTNTITANNGDGVGLRWWCKNNSISANTITRNNGHGIELHWQSNDNSIYHNNFIGNAIQAYAVNSLGNIWDDGYPSGGNYWSDYTGMDLYSGPDQDWTGSDGIGDMTYIINGTNQDRYPLMNPWIPIETSIKVNDKDYPVTIVSNTTIDQIVATANTLHFKSSGPTGQKGYINVIFPMVNTTEIKVFIDDVKLTPPPFPVINTNGTHYFIYFEFTLSAHAIAVQFAPIEYTLTINSSPSGVKFTVDDISHTTPWSDTYDEGTSVSLEMPQIHTADEARYYWNRWSDGETSRSRTVTMNTNITLTAHYTGPYYQLTVTSSPLTGITFTVNEALETTPYTEWLLEGSYTLVMPETHEGYVWSHWLEDGDTSRTKTITLPATTWTGVYEPAPPPPAIGGEMILIRVNKPPHTALTRMFTWIGLVSAVISTVAVSVVYTKHRKRKQTE